MNRVLIITSILPINEISRKKDENDILFVLEKELKKRHKNIEFVYLYTQIYSNPFLGLFSKRWKEYSKLKDKEMIEVRGRSIHILPLILLPKKVLFRDWLIRLSLFFYGDRLKKLIATEKPTVVHAQTVGTSAYLARLIKKEYNIPFIVTLRGLHQKLDRIDKAVLGGTDKYVAISPSQQKDFRKEFDHKINLIPHGIPNKFYQETKIKKNEGIRLFFIGRLLALKNIELVIKSIENFSNVSFDIIGEGIEQENLNKLIKKKGLETKVNFLGRLAHDEIIKLIPEYDLFVMPSYPETLGRVYFEVMASGIPVVASKNTGVDGIVTNGKEGFLVDHKSTDELINTLKKISKNPEILIEMGDNARVLANKYNWDEVSKKYYSLYTSL